MVDFTRLPLDLGAMTATPAAMAALARSEQTLLTLLARHVVGDWGDVDDQERADNWAAIAGDTGSVASVYAVGGATLLVVTNMDPRETSVLLAEEA
jgi:hypothetical protein